MEVPSSAYDFCLVREETSAASVTFSCKQGDVHLVYFPLQMTDLQFQFSALKTALTHEVNVAGGR